MTELRIELIHGLKNSDLESFVSSLLKNHVDPDDLIDELHEFENTDDIRNRIYYHKWFKLFNHRIEYIKDGIKRNRNLIDINLGLRNYFVDEATEFEISYIQNNTPKF